MGSQGTSSVIQVPVTISKVDITNLVTSSGVAKSSITPGSSTTYHIFQQAPSDGYPSGAAANDILQQTSAGVWSLYMAYANYAFNDVVVYNLLTSSGSTTVNQTYNKANNGWASYLPAVIGMPTPTDDTTTTIINLNNTQYLSGSYVTHFVNSAISSIIGGPAGLSFPISNGVSLYNYWTANRVDQELIINNVAYLRTYQNSNWSAWKTQTTNDQIPGLNYVTKLITQSSYNQFGFIDKNNKLYQNYGSDGFPLPPFGYNNTIVPYPFGQQQFRDATGAVETGNLIDAGVLMNFSYALFDNGNLYTWGINVQSCCVTGDNNSKSYPVLSTTNVAKVFAPRTNSYDINYSSLFILKNDGFLYGGGSNENGELGLNTTVQYTTWQKITYFPANTVQSVWNIKRTTFVQKTDGTIHACGYNGSGQLGTGNTTQYQTFQDVTTAWGGVAAGTIINLSGATSYNDGATNYQAIVIMHRRTSGGVDSIYSCGSNAWNQIGNGTGTDISTPYKVGTNVATNFPNSIKKMVAHGGSVLTIKVLANNGDLWSWGYNGYGQVGDGTTTNRSIPYVVQTGVSDVYGDGASSHTYPYRCPSYIKLNSGQIQACGLNDNGQLGIGNITQQTTYQNVLFPKDVNIVDLRVGNKASGLFAVALDDIGQLWGIGWNATGLLDPYQTGANMIVPRRILINFTNNSIPQGLNIINANTSYVNNMVTVTSNYTASTANNVILCNNSSSMTVTLPDASQTTGIPFTIKRLTTNPVSIVSADGTQTIDGTFTYAVSGQYNAITVASNGFNYYII